MWRVLQCLPWVPLCCCCAQHLSTFPVLQGQPMWMEHVAGIDVVGMQAAGVTLDDYVFYSCRVSCMFHQIVIPQLQSESSLRTPSP